MMAAGDLVHNLGISEDDSGLNSERLSALAALVTPLPQDWAGRFMHALDLEAACPRCGHRVNALALTATRLKLCRRCCIEVMPPLKYAWWWFLDLIDRMTLA